MKSIMKRSLALVITAAMLLSMLAVPAFAGSHSHVSSLATQIDNEPCEHVKNGTATAVKGETVAATCVKAGGTWMSCPECHDTWLADPTPIDPEAHNYEDTVKDPTCQNEGYTAKVCLNGCGNDIGKTDVREPLGPNYQADPEHVSDGGDCVTNGVFYWVCANANCDCALVCDAGAGAVYCVDKNNDGKVDKTEHNCKKWVDNSYVADGHNIKVVEPDECAADADDELVYLAPNCTESGKLTFVCEDCDAIWSVDVAPYGHEENLVAAVGATCITTGYQAGSYCDRFVDEDQDGHADVDEDGNVIRCSHTVGAYDATKRGKEAFVTPVVDHNYVDLTGKIRVVEVEGKLYLTDDTTIAEVDAHFGGICAPAGGTPVLGYQYKQCDKGCEEVMLVEGVAPEHVPYTGATVPGDPLKVAPQVVANDCDNWGYTWYTCSVCGASGENDEDNVEKLRDNFVAPEHTYLPTASGTNKIVYTYKEVNADGTTKWGEDGKPIYKTDATGAIFYNYTGVAISGYAAVAWIENVAPMCDVQANFVHDCIKCDHGLESLKFTLEHIRVENSEVFHGATCTEDAFYTATCANPLCPGSVDGYELDIELPAEGPADGPIKGTGATVSYKALGHLSQDGITRSATGQLIAATSPDCTNPGNTAFYACFDVNCTVPALKAAAAKVNADGTANVVVGDAAYLAPNGHDYTGTKAYAATCSMPSFKVVACSVCEVEKWSEESLAASAWDARIPASVGFDGDATGEHEYEKVADGTPSTCVEFGTEDLYECKYCGVASTEVGQRGSAYKTAKKPYVQAQYTFDITCNAPGYVYNYCANCVDADILVWDDVQKKYVDNTADSVDVPAGHEWTFDHEFGIPNADEHVIKGAVYLEENGVRVVRNGRYVILNFSKDPVTGEVKLLEADMLTVINPSASYTGPAFTAKDGGCDDRTDDVHQNAYECATCGEAFLASVYLEHTYDKTATPTCETSVDCSACGKVILDKVEHDWQLDSTVNFDCLVAGYEIWKCSYADCTYTDAADAVADADARCDTTLTGIDYRFTDALAAPGHTYDPAAKPTCETDVVCSVCTAVIHAAPGHNEDAGVYTNPTCDADGYTTYTCSNENCDYPDNKRVVVDTGSMLGHNFGVTQYKLHRDADCYVFGYTIAFCYNCHLEVQFDSASYESDWGHTIDVDTVPPSCEAPGKTVEYCTVCNPKDPVTGEIDATNVATDWAGVPAYKDVTTTTEGMEQLVHTNKFIKDLEELNKLENNCKTIAALIALYNEKTADAETASEFFGAVVPTLDEFLTCDNGCGVKFELKADSHAWVEGRQEQTCTQQGVQFQYCENCDVRNIISVVDPLGHGHTAGTDWVTDVEATCTTEGSQYLKCFDCNLAVALGEPVNTASGIVAADKVTDTIEAHGHNNWDWITSVEETCDEDGTKILVCYTCKAAGEDYALVKVGEYIVDNAVKVKVTEVTDSIPYHGHNFVEINRDPATIYEEGTIYYACDCTDCDCTETKTESIDKLEGVLVSGEYVNANAPDALITNKSVIAYTVYLEGDNKVVDMITIRLDIDPDELIYVGYELPTIDATTKGNIFGTTFGAGSASTSVGVNDEGRIIVFAENSTGEDVVVGEKSALVTLYFEVNAEVIGAKGGKTSVTIELDESAKGTGSMVDVDGLDVLVDADADVIEINKLGDLNGDGYINIVDLKAIKAIILEGGYDARADIDQDGFVDNFDRLAVLDYILTDDYAAFLAYNGAEAYAL